MTAEERIEQLEAENAALGRQLAEALEDFGQALGRIQELEGQLAKVSHTSLKPPSSDGPTRQRPSQRHRSEKPTGGQPGPAGHTLIQLANPDEGVRHPPLVCPPCQQPLEGVAGAVKERREVHDLPQGRLLVHEPQQVEEVCCPAWKPGQSGELSGRSRGAGAVWADPARLGGLSACVSVGAAGSGQRTAG